LVAKPVYVFGGYSALAVFQNMLNDVALQLGFIAAYRKREAASYMSYDFRGTSLIR
jgi:hypothetical protein